MKHPYEIKKEINRIKDSGYLHVDEWDNHASDYDRARKWQMYIKTLEAYLDNMNKIDEWLHTINNSVNKLENQIKEYKAKKNKNHFYDEDDCERAEINVAGCKLALSYITSESTIIEELKQSNKEIDKKIKELNISKNKNCEMIKEVSEWLNKEIN